ncbi:MAG: hypothetical protein WAO00_11620 [Chthoniobacterales bacterium]
MIRKFEATIRVLLSNDRRQAFPPSGEICGYYRSVLLYAGDNREARSLLGQRVGNDGEIDWSKSELVEVKRNAVDWIRILCGNHFIRESGRAFFPFEDAEQRETRDTAIGWRMSN